MASQPRAIRAAALAADALDPAAMPALRRRMRWTLFAISALGSTGYIAAVTVGTLAAAEMAGGAALGGVPTAVATLGTAAAASLISAAMLRSGRRPALLGALLVGVLGALVALVGVVVGSIAVLLVGSAFSGAANAAGNLGRYVAGDLAPPERRASAIGTVVWGATLGSVTGPNLVAPSGQVATAIGLPELAGAYVVTSIFVGLAFVLAFVMLRPEPYALADPSALAAPAADVPPASMRSVLRRPTVVVAFATLAAGQVVMVLIMTMTPIHLTAHGHGLSTVGFVLSAHTFGMFALSPLSGRLTDRFGSPAVIIAGLLTLAAAATIAALAPVDGGLVLTFALFLLGYGWNLGFVAGSTMLTRGLALAERTRVQGVADGLVWLSAALSSLLSGVIVAAASYTALGVLAAVMLAPILLIVAARPLAWRPS